VAARARRDPAAERGEFERLHVVAQRETGGLQLRLEFFAQHAALDACRLGHRIHLEYAVEMAQVDAHDPVRLRRLDAGDHAGAPP